MSLLRIAALEGEVQRRDARILELETLLATPAASVPAGVEVDPQPCPNCDGEGFVMVASDNGPDAYDVAVDCPHCDGKQTLMDAYNGVVKLLKKEQASHRKTYSIIWGFYKPDEVLVLQRRLTHLAEQTKTGTVEWLRDRLKDIAESATGYLSTQPPIPQDAASAVADALLFIDDAGKRFVLPTNHDSDGIARFRAIPHGAPLYAATPAGVQPTLVVEVRKLAIEEAARVIYESWSDEEGYRPWTIGGNSDKQEDARRQAAAEYDAALSSAAPGQGVGS